MHGGGQTGVAAPNDLTVQPGGETLPLRGGKIGDGGKGDAFFPAVGGDGGGKGVGAGGLQGMGDRQQAVIQLLEIGDGGLPGGDGPGFIQYHGGDAAGTLQRLGAFYQNTVFGAPAGSHHNGGGGGQSQRTGAADDQHRNADGEGKGGGLSHQQPNGHGQHRNADDHRHKDGGDPVGDALNGCFGGGGVLHQTDDLRKGGFLPHVGGPHGEVPAAAQGGPGDGVSRLFIHRQAFPGDGGLIDGGLPFSHGAVHRDGLPRTDDEQVPLPYLLQRDLGLPAVPQQAGGGGRQRHQLLQGVGGVTLTAGLPVFPHADEGKNGAGGLEVEVHVVLRYGGHIPGGQPLRHAENGIDAIQHRSGGAYRNEGIHGGGAPEQRRKAPAEIPELQNDDGKGEDELRQPEPQGVFEAGEEGGQRQPRHMPHGDVEQYRQKPHADPQAGTLAAGSPRRGRGGGAARGARRAGAVAGRGHGRADGLRGEGVFIVVYRHAVLHQIHRDRPDPGQGRDRPFHVGAAGSAAHAGDRKALFHGKVHLRGIIYDPIINSPAAGCQ